MELIKIDKTNIEVAIKLQNIIFPIYHGDNNYYESLIDNSNKTYYLIKVDDAIVGITGLYFYHVDSTSGWLGWFEILKEYRRHHYGKESLMMIEQLAREKKTINILDYILINMIMISLIHFTNRVDI